MKRICTAHRDTMADTKRLYDSVNTAIARAASHVPRASFKWEGGDLGCSNSVRLVVGTSASLCRGQMRSKLLKSGFIVVHSRLYCG